LEARLNTSSGANAPFIDGMNPIHHIMNAKIWLANAGFKDVSAKTFLADINAPLDDNTKNALLAFFDMLWGESENQISKKDWKKYKKLCDPNSNKDILNNQHYYGFYTYTLFSGIK
ncbi:MAG: methyltransferase type 11, partial [Candidatus Lokiarchaeota archaeon]